MRGIEHRPARPARLPGLGILPSAISSVPYRAGVRRSIGIVRMLLVRWAYLA